MALAESGDSVAALAAAAQVRRVDPLFEAGNFGSRFANQADREKVQRALGKAGF